MHGTITTSRPSHSAKRLTAWVALFWAFSYILLSARAQLGASDASFWISGIRLVSITIGSLFFAFALWTTMRLPNIASRPTLLICNIVAAALTILLIRYLVAPNSDNPQSAIAEHAGWVLVWTGYFGLWVAAFYAISSQRASFVRIRTAALPTAVSPPITRPVAKPLDPSAAEAWSWMAETLASELTGQPAEAQTTLIATLRRRAGYEIADDFDGTATEHNARVKLIERLVKDLQAKQTSRSVS